MEEVSKRDKTERNSRLSSREEAHSSDMMGHRKVKSFDVTQQHFGMSSLEGVGNSSRRIAKELPSPSSYDVSLQDYPIFMKPTKPVMRRFVKEEKQRDVLSKALERYEEELVKTELLKKQELEEA